MAMAAFWVIIILRSTRFIVLLFTLGMDQCMLNSNSVISTEPHYQTPSHSTITTAHNISHMSTLLNVNFFQFHIHMPADSDYLYLLKQLWERKMDSIQARLMNVSYNCRTMKAAQTNRQCPNMTHHSICMCMCGQWQWVGRRCSVP